jgi:predicted transcriptional regulator
VVLLNKNRDRLSIVAAILEAANSGASKTHIMLGANLSFNVLEKYLDVVVRAGFVRVAGRRYELTGPGREFLRRYRHFYERYVGAQRLLEALDCEREKLDLMCEASGFAVFKHSQKRGRPKSPLQLKQAKIHS